MTDLMQIVNQSGLDQTKGQALLEKFSGYFDLAADWERKAKALEVTNVNQVAEMRMAREGRLFLRQKRIDVENTRKELKEASLREGQTIDSIARILTNLIIPIENDLRGKEEYAERKAAEEKEALREARTEQLRQFLPEALVGQIPGNLDEMTEQGFQDLLQSAKDAAEARAAREARAKALAEQEARDREAREKEARERQKALEAENKRLAAEAAEAQKKAQEMRAKIEKEKERVKKIAEEAKARIAEMEAVQKEKERAAEAEAKRIAQERETRARAEAKAREAAARKAAKAPDKEKIKEVADSIFTYALGLLEQTYIKVSPETHKTLDAFSKRIVSACNDLRRDAEDF